MLSTTLVKHNRTIVIPVCHFSSGCRTRLLKFLSQRCSGRVALGNSQSSHPLTKRLTLELLVITICIFPAGARNNRSQHFVHKIFSSHIDNL